MTDKQKNEEVASPVRLPHEPLPIDKVAYVNKARKVAPVIARKHCQLDQIEAALKAISDGISTDVVETEHGDLVELQSITETEEALMGICATLAQMLREEWTYK